MIQYYIDPSYSAYYNNKLFDLSDDILNRDNTLRYFYNLKKRLYEKGIVLNTADNIFKGSYEKHGVYISLGLLSNYKKINDNYPNIKLKSFAILEPPVVAPKLYKNIDPIYNFFEKVYLHNQNYKIFSYLKKFPNNIKNIKKLYWPIDDENLLDKLFFNNRRFNHPVLIQANKKPTNHFKELYSLRVKKIIEFNKIWRIDLYGSNWNTINRNNILWMPYIKNYFKLKEINRGPINTKYKILSKYDFCLCIENMDLEGYVTEKIFDCFFCGTIPIYKGSESIKKYIPNNTFISIDDFKSTQELIKYSLSLTEKDKLEYKANIMKFLKSNLMKKYYYSIDDMFE